MKQIYTWLKAFTFFVMMALFPTLTYAVDIALNGSITEISGDLDPATCKAGDIYRLGTTATYGGQALDILVEITAEDNEYDELAANSSGPCIGVSNGILDTRLRDTDADNNSAFMDLNITTVLQGTSTLVEVDRITFTAFDLDINADSGTYATGSDDIYMISPTRGYLQEGGTGTLVQYSEGTYGDGYDIRMQGNLNTTALTDPVTNASTGNCLDNASTVQPECRSGGIAVEGPNGPNKVSSVSLRVSNDNAYGDPAALQTYDDAGETFAIFRLIQISFKEIDFEAIVATNTDHGDAPSTYGDAEHNISVYTVLGYGYPADHDNAQYSIDADADDNPDLGNINFDDEDGVRIGNQPTTSSELNMTVGFDYDLNVTSIGTGYLSAWIDLNGDGDFADTGENILSDSYLSSVVAVETIIPISIPSNNYVGQSYVRFRFSEDPGVLSSGVDGKGEVEDYTVFFNPAGNANGHLYNDINGNGTQDVGEPGLAGVDVIITAANGETKTVTTDVNGDYNATAVAVGMASIDIDNATLPAGVVQTEGNDPTSVTINANVDNFEQNNGFQEQADLVTVKTVNSANASSGDTVTFTITVTNNGGSTATNVTLTDTLPIGMNYTASNPAQGTYNSVTGVWNIGTLANGANTTLTLSGTIDPGTESGTLRNVTTAAATPDQHDPSTVGDILQASVAINPITVPPGSCYASTWGTSPWTWTTAVDNGTIVISPELSLTIDVSTTASGDLDSYGGTQVDTLLLGGVDDLGVFFDPDAGQGTSPVVITLTFDKPVFSTSFLISDIDRAGPGLRKDKITVTSDAGIPTLQTVTTSTPTFTLTGNTAAAADTIPSSNDNAGTVSVVIPDGATTVTILYEDSSGLDDPAGRGIGILGNLGVCVGGTIQGSVKNDVGAALPGTTVTLKDLGGVTVSTTTTDGSGQYTFINVAPGDYTVVETTPANYISISDGDSTASGDDTANVNVNDDSIPVSVIAGEVDDGNDFVDKMITVVSITDSNVTEGTDENHTVVMSDASGSDATYAFTVVDNTTDVATDYTAPTFTNGVVDNGDGTITVPAGVTTFDVIIPTTGDIVDENEEFYELTIGGQTATGTITDDDTAGITITDANETEGDDLVFDVNLTTPSATDTVVTITTTTGTAGAADYTETSTTVTIPAGETGVKVTVPSTDDNTRENEEQFTITATLPNGTSAEGTGTIVDNDPLTVLIGDANETEATDLVFDVNISNPSDTDTVVTIVTTPGTASGTDYTAPAATVTIPAGETGVTVTVPSTDDATDEGEEQFTITATLDNGSTDEGTGTITDDDTAGITITDANETEGDDLVFDVNLTTPSATDTVVTITTTTGTAGAADYTETSTTVTIPAGETGVKVTVPSTDDNTRENEEQFTITATLPNGTSAEGTGTIVDNDPLTVLIGDANETEATDLVFDVNISNPSDTDTVVTIVTTPGTASGTDYTAPAATVTIPAGETGVTVTVPSTDDATDEGEEQFTITATLDNGSTDEGTGTITDDDTAGITITDANETEGDDLVFDVNLTTPSATDTVVTITTTTGTAGAADYTETSTTVTIPAGETGVKVTVPSTDDNTRENEEQFTITATLPNGTSAEGTGTIVDNDPLTVLIGDANETEATDLVFDVNISNPSDTDTVVTIVTTPGTASGTDYTAPAATVTIPAGETGVTVTVPSTDDATDEGEEQFTITATLDNGSTDEGTGTITDDDTAGITITDANETEGDDLVFDVNLTTPSATDTVVTITTTTGTAGAADYTETSTTVTIPAGETGVKVTVPSTDDNTRENEEQFTITATLPNGTSAEGTGTIVDNDPLTVLIGDANETEATDLVFDVNISNPSDTDTVVTIVTTPGTASGTDYTAPAATVTIPAGETGVTVTVPSTDDATDEGEEQFTITATLDNGSTDEGTGTITDDDTAGITITDANETEGDDLVFDVNLTTPSATDTVVTITTTTGTAGAADYTETSTTVTIPAGETGVKVTVPSTDDNTRENEEQFTITATLPNGTSAEGTGTIVDNDPLTVLIGDANETEATDLVFDVNISNPSDTDTVVTIVTTPGTASGTDYTAPAATVTIPAGETGVTVTVPSTDDATDEGEEQFTITATLDNGSTDEGTGTITDDDTAGITITDANETEGDDLVFDVNLTTPSATDTVVTITTTTGTAGAADYTETSTTVTIPAGETGVKVTVPSTDDNTRENEEQFTITATLPNGTSAEGTGTIVDNDPLTVLIGDANETEATDLVFDVNISNPSDTDTVVTIVTTPGTASGTDYTAPAATVTIPAGETGVTVTVPSTDDATDEGEEQFTITATLDNGSTDEGTGTITDDDTAGITITDANETEGDDLVFDVNLTTPSATDTVVTITTTTGTAGAADYTETSTTVTIPAGETGVKVTVPSTDDNTRENEEQFTITATLPNGTSAEGTGTIVDNDPLTVLIGDANETEATDLVFDVNISNPSDTDTVVTIVTTPGTASGTDYTAPAATVTIPAGETGVTVTVPSTDDATDEGEEQFTITATLDNGSTDEGTGTITDDDTATGIVAGIVYEDTNGNGMQDPEENGIANITVSIIDSEGREYNVTTNDEGAYSQVVPTGDTVIDVDETTLPAGLEHNSAGEDPTTLTAVEDDIVTDLDGYTPTGTPVAYVAGIVYLDADNSQAQDNNEAGIANITVTIEDSEGNMQTVSTDGNGEYNATVIPGSVTVTVEEGTLPGGVVQSEGDNPTTLTAVEDETVSSTDGYAPTVAMGEVTGVIFEDTNGNGVADEDEGLSGVTVTITDSQGGTQEVVTDDNGTYAVLVPAGEVNTTIDETTLPADANQTVGQNPTTLTVPVNGTAEDIDGFEVLATATIHGVVFEDIDGNGIQDGNDTGISDITVTIIDSDGSIQTLTTDENGEYNTSVAPGNVLVTVEEGDIPAGYVDTTNDNPTTVNVPVNGVGEDSDGFQPPAAPVAVDDNKTGTVGNPVNVDVLANDSGDNPFDPTTVDLDPLSVPGAIGTDTDGDDDIDEVEVPGEGTWKAEDNGTVTFTPEVGFIGSPQPLDYSVKDIIGNDSNVATITIVVEANLPDYRPTVNILVGQSVNTPTETLKVRYRIVENIGGKNNGPLVVFIAKHESMATSYDDVMTAIDGVDVDNGDWTFSESNAFYELTYNGNGGEFPPNSTSYIGFEFNFTAPETQRGKIPLKITIQGALCGDIEPANDSDEDSLIFNNL